MTRHIFAILALLIALAPAFAQKEFGFDNRKGSGQPYLKPEETVAKFKVPPEFEVKLFAGEPMMTNPIAFTIDERGRIWIVESFEYPKRTPKGQKPRDRIVILEDTDGDGVADKRTVFAEGKDFPESFDMASGIEVGHGGVYLGAPPYLWYIENKDDKPGKFEILAKGFGSQDTHETLNTFQWGPDGWLYGLHGIFSQSNVKVGNEPEIKMNAAVWRLHPKTKKFEIFSEGTSNPWGMDWRNTDGQFILASCVIPHLYHMVPGGIYQRQGGVSNNPYAYNFIKEISDHTFHRESGWAHAGLISLDVPHMPERFRNSVIFGSIHGCSLKQNILKPNGSSYVASRGDDFLTSGDKNVRPINLKWGPLGDIYLIDWHDQNPCHQTKADEWDYERGRVYRIQLKGTTPKKALDLGKKEPQELAVFAVNDDPYLSRTAMRLLHEMPVSRKVDATKLVNFREARSNLPRMMNLMNATIDRNDDEAKNKVAKFSIPAGLANNFPADIAGSFRDFGESAHVTDITIAGMATVAEVALHPEIRRELASAAIRLANKHDVTPLVRALMSRKEDANDALIPHLTWIAYEKVISKRAAVGTDADNKPVAMKSPAEAELAWLAENAGNNPFITDQIIPKVMRRLLASGQPGDLLLCIQFLDSTKDVVAKRKALEGIVVALQGQLIDAPKIWANTQTKLLTLKDDGIKEQLNKLAVTFRDPQAHKRATAIAINSKKTIEERTEAIRQIAVIRNADAIKFLFELLKTVKSEPLQIESIRALGSFNDQAIPIGLISHWGEFTPALRNEIVNVLSSRKEWAASLLSAMKEKVIERTAVTDNTISRIQSFKDRTLNALIEDAWGRTRTTPDELNALIDKTRIDVNTGTGSYLRGQKVFENQCNKCHKFEGKGSDVGPALDGAGRDIEYLLGNILDPNRVIGAPYFVRQINTLDGQVLQGLLAEEDDRTITIKVENGVLKKIVKKDIDGEVKVLEKSMMPEGLGYSMTPQDFRDLICYVMAHPYINDVTVDGIAKSAPVGGRIPLTGSKDGKPVTIEAKFTAQEAMKTKLLVGAGDAYEVSLDGKVVGKGNGKQTLNPNPDGEDFEVSIPKGEHTLTISLKHKGAARWIIARFLDPNRKLSYIDSGEKKPR